MLGLYFDEIGREPLLGPDEELDLLRRAQLRDSATREPADREARDRVVRANLRLVVHLSRRFLGRGLSLADLISEGNFGLFEAIDRFDCNLGLRFTTYATPWVRCFLRRAVRDQGTTIRVPGYLHDALYSGKPHRRDPARLEAARRVLESGGREAVGETDLAGVADADDAEPGAGMEAAERAEMARSLLDRLDARQAAVVADRMGLDGSPRTLREIGEGLGLTRERVRQIERDALFKLRCLLCDPDRPWTADEDRAYRLPEAALPLIQEAS